jgi:hypothetical protein
MGQWEERFESRYGRWRGFVDEVVARYLDCGVFDAGFARVQCRDRHAEYLVACSCKGRGLCPSCGAKRAAAFAAFLHDEVLEPVGHALWTFSIPKLIRPYFLHHRELLGKLCHAAWETVQELMAAAAGEVDGFRTGMVVAAQTAGDSLGLNPHLHALVRDDRKDRCVAVRRDHGDASLQHGTQATEAVEPPVAAPLGKRVLGTDVAQEREPRGCQTLPVRPVPGIGEVDVLGDGISLSSTASVSSIAKPSSSAQSLRFGLTEAPRRKRFVEPEAASRWLSSSEAETGLDGSSWLVGLSSIPS